ncbi:MAG: hypothetical protein JW896_16275 [Deltaproteobacteria bacterium]|nr:hypothetical protein [Deltaproteobacteria bacterium]
MLDETACLVVEKSMKFRKRARQSPEKKEEKTPSLYRVWEDNANHLLLVEE